MNLGELAFSLGFKSTGIGEAKNFQNALSSTQDVTEVLSQSMESLNEILTKIALKMGAITQAEVTELKTNKDLLKNTNQLNTAKHVGNEKSKQNLGIIANINSKMKSYWGALSTVRLQIMASAAALSYFAKKASDAAVHIDKISSLTGLSTTSLQRMGDMAAQTGASIDDVAGAVRHFQEESVNIMLGRGGNIGVYQFLGLNPHDDPLKLLDQLSRKLKTMPTALGTTMAKDLGLSDDMIYLLKNTQNLKPPADGTLLSEKEIRRLKEFNFYFNRVFEQGKRVLQKFAAFLTPITTQIVYVFDRIGTMFAGVMEKMEPFFVKLKQYMPYLAVIGGVLFAAFFPLTAALVGISLVLEDLWSFVQGDDSLFGRMLKWLTDINGAIKDAIHYYVQLRKLFTLGKHDEYFDQMEKDLLTGAEGFLKKVKDKEENPERKKNLENVNNIVDRQFDQINPDIKTGIENLVKSASGFMNINAKTGSAGATTNNNNADITINVNESKTPKETANSVKEAVGNAYWQRKGGAR